jgi:3-isopropylmalate/(R)-2-methylmalate dehydratase small subunit
MSGASEVKIKGKVWKYGRNVDTDVIIPGRHCHLSEPEDIAPHALEDLDPEFAGKVKKGDLIVAEDNFGCGSSRELAPLAIKSCGVGAVVASSFARIFYRNSINVGLPIFESAEAVAGIEAGDEVEIEPDTGVIRNLTKSTNFQASGFPPFIQDIISAGGLMNYVVSRLKGTGRSVG